MSASPSATQAKPSFLRGLFQGEITEALLFPYPATLDVRRPDEAATVHRLIAALGQVVRPTLRRWPSPPLVPTRARRRR